MGTFQLDMRLVYAICVPILVTGDKCPVQSTEVDSEWNSDAIYRHITVDLERCDIPIVEIPTECSSFANLNSPDCRKFNHFLSVPTEPIIFRGLTDSSSFRDLTRKSQLLRTYGEREVILSTANQFSHNKVKTSFADYITQHVSGDRPSLEDLRKKSASEVFYKFGDNYWNELLNKYHRPDWYHGQTGALSFGIGGSGSGVPFHIHGPVFAEVFHGLKRWFFSPPGKRPEFDGEELSLFWFERLVSSGKLIPPKDVTVCTAKPGDMVFIPDQWWHATLNIGETVFMSDFV
eukprot:GDKJ01043014.1.p1 GENE.GDKJ01043014.1~~GDKJ01043014.1.p1  ORF type:complete len:290 (-),score=30.52 GDKJ01043014.1:23-892(-)